MIDNKCLNESGIMLYEMTHPTPNQQPELSDTLRGVRNQKFPSGFDRTNSVNEWIVKMLSDDPDKRPRTSDILQELQRIQKLKSTLKSESSMKKSSIMTSAHAFSDSVPGMNV